MNAKKQPRDDELERLSNGLHEVGPASLFWLSINLHRQMGERILTEPLTAGDMEKARTQMADLNLIASEIAANPPDRATFKLMNRLIVIVSTLGGLGWQFESTRQIFANLQTQPGRDAYLAKIEAAEQALQAAIKAVWRPGRRGKDIHKEVVLDPRLMAERETAGLGPVSLGVVYKRIRQLKKFDSDKSKKKKVRS